MDQNQNPDKTNNRDTSEIKQKILSVIKRKGPSLPVHIAREIGSDMLFTSAFLSELVSEKKLKLSSMRVGNSPLYLIPGQESQLEDFTEYLNSKEKEALELLKKEKTLEDSEQEPSVRVALRSLRDFAKPFKKEGKIFWRHVNVDEKNVKGEEMEKALPKTSEKELDIFDKNKEEKNKENSEEETSEESKKDDDQKEREEDSEETKESSEKSNEKKNEEKLPDKPKEKIKVKERKKVKKKSKTSSSKTKKEKFFDKIKEYLDNQNIKLKDIVGFGRKRVSLIVEYNGERKFLMAYDKKRINETDIGRASKGAKKHNLPYIILSKGGPLKRIKSLKKDLEDLSGFKRF